MRLTTNLELIKKHNPCNSNPEDSRQYGWNRLIDYLGDDYPKDKEINLLTILKSHGVQDCLWALRCTVEDSTEVAQRLAIEFAERVLPIFEKEYPDDVRPRKAIEVVKKYLEGNASLEDVKNAAYAAAYAAADAASDAAYAAYAAYAADAAVYASDAAVYAFNAAVYAFNAAVYATISKSKEIEEQAKIIREFINK